MNRDATWDAISARKQAAREKLMDLPWREKLRRLDAMKERQELLRAMRQRIPGENPAR
jgi:hypothetical protein